MPLYDFDPPERFVAGTVGPPGQRTFFLQASGGGRVLSVSLEKEQVKVLGERLGDLLDSVAGVAGSEEAGEALTDNAPLDTPIEDDFRVLSLSLAWDAERQSVIVEAHDHAVPDEDEEEDLPDPSDRALAESLRVVLRPAAARAFAQRCVRSVEGGRPNCPFCGQPLDPEGHICPRANGYRR